MRFPLSASVFAFSVFTSLCAVRPTHAASVLLLGDDEAQTQVALSLQAAGHQVTVASRYWEWNGFSPSAFDHDVVVLLSGESYEDDLDPDALAVLQLYLLSGCGLVTTEWSAYSVENGYKSAAFGELLPVSSPEGEYDEGSAWLVLAPSHPLVAGLPSSFLDAGGWSQVNPRQGAVVVITDPAQSNNPLLTYTQANGGRSVHINHDLTYNLGSVPANILKLIENAVRFASCALFRSDFEDGGTEVWE